MCGIAGIYSQKKIPKSELERLHLSIKHRGPDNSGIFIDPPVGLAYRRLTIIDTTEQRQPILHNEDKSLWISFNGEIYNFPPLRQMLTSRGHHFYTNTDTEMILHLYEEYGENCVKKLNGMFAFALWDAKKGQLLLARDHLGVKPLYYTQAGDKFIFGSEIKALLTEPSVQRTIDPVSLDAFMSLRYIPGPRTIYKDIYKLQPGHILTLKGSQQRIKKYWDFNFQPSSLSQQKLTQKVRDLLTESIEMQLLADVPLGAFLSGGIDSSIVVGVMSQIMSKPVKTFSIGFKAGDRFDERHFARLLSQHFHTDHHEIVIDYDAVRSLPEIIYHLDEPMADPAAIPTLLLSQAARKKVKVVLTGEGADELFGGYWRDVPNRVAPLFNLLPITSRRHLAQILGNMPQVKGKRYLHRGSLPFQDRAVHVLKNSFNKYPKKNLYSADFQNQLTEDWEQSVQQHLRQDWDEFSQMLYLETKVWLVDDPLMKVDKMTMAASLEARVPFLDPRLVELAATIPSEFKYKNGISKYILREAMKDVLPDEIFRRPKHGFDVPIDHWLRHELSHVISTLLSPQQIRETGVFDPDSVDKILAHHRSGRHALGPEIWNILNFQIWHKIYIQGEKWQKISELL